VVPHTVKDVLAKASKEGVSSLCISLLVVNLITNKIGGNLRFCEALGNNSIHSNIYGLYVRPHVNFSTRKIISLKHGRGSIPVGHLALGG
jgi:hypothetical protein